MTQIIFLAIGSLVTIITSTPVWGRWAGVGNYGYQYDSGNGDDGWWNRGRGGYDRWNDGYY